MSSLYELSLLALGPRLFLDDDFRASLHEQARVRQGMMKVAERLVKETVFRKVCLPENYFFFNEGWDKRTPSHGVIPNMSPVLLYACPERIATFRWENSHRLHYDCEEDTVVLRKQCTIPQAMSMLKTHTIPILWGGLSAELQQYGSPAVELTPLGIFVKDESKFYCVDDLRLPQFASDIVARDIEIQYDLGNIEHSLRNVDIAFFGK